MNITPISSFIYSFIELEQISTLLSFLIIISAVSDISSELDKIYSKLISSLRTYSPSSSVFGLIFTLHKMIKRDSFQSKLYPIHRLVLSLFHCHLLVPLGKELHWRSLWLARLRHDSIDNIHIPILSGVKFELRMTRSRPRLLWDLPLVSLERHNNLYIIMQSRMFTTCTKMLNLKGVAKSSTALFHKDLSNLIFLGILLSSGGSVLTKEVLDLWLEGLVAQ